MITRQQAEQLMHERINTADPSWPDKPEMIVVHVESHEMGWVMSYTTRPYHETREFRFAIAGNAPCLVSNEDGSIFATGTAPSFEERLHEAEIKLKEHLRTKKP